MLKNLFIENFQEEYDSKISKKMPFGIETIKKAPLSSMTIKKRCPKGRKCKKMHDKDHLDKFTHPKVIPMI